MPVNCSTGFRARLLGTSSFESMFNGGCIEVYGGAIPASSNLAPTGPLLGRITANGEPWTNGSPVNGLQFARDTYRATKSPTQPWVLQGLATGTAVWARLRGVSDTGAASSSLARIDMAVGPLEGAGDYQIRLPTTALSASTVIPITEWWFVLPPIE